MRIKGPKFKDTDKYLTNQGYPLGTTCFYYIIEFNGWRKVICGDTIGQAAINVIRWLKKKSHLKKG